MRVIKAVCCLLPNNFCNKDRTNLLFFFVAEERCCEGSNFYFQFFLSTVFFFSVVKLLLCPLRSRGCVKGDNTCNVRKPLGPLTFSARIVTDDMYHWPTEVRHLHQIPMKPRDMCFFSHNTTCILYLNKTHVYSFLQLHTIRNRNCVTET